MSLRLGSWCTKDVKIFASEDYRVRGSCKEGKYGGLTCVCVGEGVGVA